MIKNETNIIQEAKNPLTNSISDKENKNRENYIENNNKKNINIINKTKEEKDLLINKNIIYSNIVDQNTANKTNSKYKNINKSNTKYNIIPLNNSTNFTSKGKKLNLIDLKRQKQLNFKPFYTAFSARNILKHFSANAEVSSFSLVNKSSTPTDRNSILNKLNKENIHNFIETNKNKPFFGSMLFKNHSHQNISKNNSNKGKIYDKNNREKNNNKILLKYS